MEEIRFRSNLLNLMKYNLQKFQFSLTNKIIMIKEKLNMKQPDIDLLSQHHQT